MTDQPDWQALTGALLLINAHNHTDDSVDADVHVLDGDHAGTYQAVSITQPALRDQLVGNAATARFNLGRLTTNGTLEEPTPQDRIAAMRHLKNAQ